MIRILFCTLLTLCMCPAGVLAQDTAPLPSSLTNQDRGQSNQDSGQSLADLARKARKDHSEETKITAAEAQKLFSAVDRITAFASEDTGLAQRSAVKRQLVGPDGVEKSSRARMGKDDNSERMARSELTMKKFGLLPREFDLKEFLIKARRKEIAGYYDDETKSVYLLNTIPLEKQEPILAHELTHALQDQNYDLRTWAKAGDAKRDENKMDLDDETRGARRAVVEGQATIVYVDYLLAPSGRNLQNTPGLIYRMEDPMIKGSIDSQMMHDSPMIFACGGRVPVPRGADFRKRVAASGWKEDGIRRRIC